MPGPDVRGDPPWYAAPRRLAVPALEVRFDAETVWLSQQQIAELFQTSRTNIVEHIRPGGPRDSLLQPRPDNALAAITLMVAMSDPREKDLMIALLVRMINEGAA